MNTLTYVTEVTPESANVDGRWKYWETNTYAEGIVWSPGPLANTVWVLPRPGASTSDAVVVHAPTGKRTEWYRVDYRPSAFWAADTWAARVARIEARNAPALSPKLWNQAIGSVDNYAIDDVEFAS